MAKACLFRKPNKSLERSLFVLLSIVLLLMLALGMFSVPQESKAMKYKKLTESTDPDGHSYGNEESRQPVEVLSWESPAFLYHNFLTKDECEYLISTVKPHMERSYVVDSKTGKSSVVYHTYRMATNKSPKSTLPLLAWEEESEENGCLQLTEKEKKLLKCEMQEG